MLKVFKWELMKAYYRMRWIFTVFAILLAVVYLMPLPKHFDSRSIYYMIAIIVSMLLIAGFTFMVFYAATYMVIELRKKYSLPEKMINQPFAIFTAVRLVTNVITVSLSCGLLKLFVDVMKKFNNNGTEFLIFNIKVHFINMLVDIAIFIPLLVLFSYMVATLLPVGEKYPRFFAAAILSAVYGLFVLLSTHVSYTLFQFVLAVISVACYIGACWIYENKYEVARYR